MMLRIGTKGYQGERHFTSWEKDVGSKTVSLKQLLASFKRIDWEKLEVIDT